MAGLIISTRSCWRACAITCSGRSMTTENHQPRLHRLGLVFLRAPKYFVTACTHQRRHIVANPSVHERFFRFAQQGSEHGAWVGAYVLMPDHFHAFVAIDDQKQSLSVWAKSLKNSISQTLRRNGIAPPHWQQTFFDHLLRSAESYTQKWHYVRENPVRAGLVKQWEDWPFRGEVFPLEYRSEY
jgi:REP-associated tyrosine transposase